MLYTAWLGLAGGGGDIDDLAAAPLLHVPDGQLGELEHGADVDVHDPVEVFEVVVDEWFADVNAGVVYQDVQAPSPLDRRGEQCLDIVRVADVRRMQADLDGSVRQVRPGFFQPGEIGGGQEQVCPRGGVSLGNGAPDTPAGTGDKSRPAGQPPRGVLIRHAYSSRRHPPP